MRRGGTDGTVGSSATRREGNGVDAKSARWHRVTPSTFPWEDEAIDFLRGGIADADPNRGWSNFEFIAGGVISEVDAFVLTCKCAPAGWMRRPRSSRC